MPLYSYFCADCHCETEEVFRIEDRRQFVPCRMCGREAKRLVGAKIERCEPTWLASAVQNLQPEGNDVRPIADRNDYKRYLRDKNIVELG